jgi:hypothetical protein
MLKNNTSPDPKAEFREQQQYATRMLYVKTTNGSKFHYDNQFRYVRKGKSGKTPDGWHQHLLKILENKVCKENEVVEAAMYDVTTQKYAKSQNKIAQLITNGRWVR